MRKIDKWVIFDLDGTLADIEERREISRKPDGKINWPVFFDPKNIELDKPNHPVIKMAQVLAATGHGIAIFSGRSKATKDATRKWLADNDVPFNLLKMRPTEHPFKYMPDEKLKSDWFDEIFANNEDRDEAEVICVFDDRQKVVDMWRKNGLTCMQVAPGNF